VAKPERLYFERRLKEVQNFATVILMAYGDEIGLHRAIVRIVPHQAKWAEYFRIEKELLLTTL
jgi:hypothetical protein